MPPWQVDVCWPPGSVPGHAVFWKRTQQRPWQEQVWLLELRIDHGSAAAMKAFIAKEVVSLGPVAASRADKAVITVNINYATDERTEMLCFKDGHAEPTLNHGLEVQGVDVPVHGLGGDSVEPLAGAASGGEVKVGLASRVGLSGLKQRLTRVL